MAARKNQDSDDGPTAGPASAEFLVGHEDAERTLYEAWRSRNLGHACRSLGRLDEAKVRRAASDRL